MCGTNALLTDRARREWEKRERQTSTCSFSQTFANEPILEPEAEFLSVSEPDVELVLDLVPEPAPAPEPVVAPASWSAPEPAQTTMPGRNTTPSAAKAVTPATMGVTSAAMLLVRVVKHLPTDWNHILGWLTVKIINLNYKIIIIERALFYILLP